MPRCGGAVLKFSAVGRFTQQSSNNSESVILLTMNQLADSWNHVISGTFEVSQFPASMLASPKRDPPVRSLAGGCRTPPKISGFNCGDYIIVDVNLFTQYISPNEQILQLFEVTINGRVLSSYAPTSAGRHTKLGIFS